MIDIYRLQASNGLMVQLTAGMRPGTSRYHTNDGFYYYCQKANGGRLFLRCVSARSNHPRTARAVVNDDMTNFHITSGFHNHAPDQYHERVSRLRDSLLEACHVRPNVRVEVIYHDICRRSVCD